MDYVQYLQAKAIQTGCEWRLKITINSSALESFPTTAQFEAFVREKDASGPVIAQLSTAAGSINRVDGNTLELVLSDAATKDWSCHLVVMDIVRIDLTQRVHLGFDLEIPVKRTITRA